MPAVGRLALIGGHSILGHEPAAAAERREIETEHGSVELLESASHLLLQRHGLSGYRTARRIEHRANLAALAELGVDRILAIGSVGGLREELGVGTFLCPDDFIALQLGLSFSDEHGGERVPAFDGTWRERVMTSWARHSDRELRDGGVYWQTLGPRFETPAEIRMFAERAHVVGMTVASECVVAGELGIAHAAICVVDNMANGAGPKPLTRAEFEAGREANRRRLVESLDAVIPLLGDEAA